MFFSCSEGFSQNSATFKDNRDGKVYKTVTIGTQTWMAENLAYRIDSGCWAYDDNPANIAKYGYLYSLETAKAICPKGWHLPSDDEWDKLRTYLGGEIVAGGTMKSTKGYKNNGNGTNSSGFAGLPGGYRDKNGTYLNNGICGIWWNATAAGASSLNWSIVLNNKCSVANDYDIDKKSGLSVRCIKDN